MCFGLGCVLLLFAIVGVLCSLVLLLMLFVCCVIVCVLGTAMGPCDLTTGGFFVEDIVRGGGLPVGLMCWLLLLLVLLVG